MSGKINLPPFSSTGARVAAVDVNGTGRDALVTDAGPLGGPEVRVLDALSPANLDSFFAFDPAFPGWGVRCRHMSRCLEHTP
jgi:hypothetical protein